MASITSHSKEGIKISIHHYENDDGSPFGVIRIEGDRDNVSMIISQEAEVYLREVLGGESVSYGKEM